MLVLEGGGIPFLNSLEMVVFMACRFWVGLVWLLVWVLGTGFASGAGTG